jgi:hypothetical protein
MEHSQQLTKYLKKMKSKSTKEWQLVNFWQDELQRSLDHQKASNEIKLLRKTAGYTLSDHNRNEWQRNSKQHPQQNTYNIEQKPATANKPNGTIQNAKTNASLRSQRKTITKETSKQMARDLTGH